MPAYTSRSRIETFLECPRHGYLRYLLDGRGVSKIGASVYLSTGQYTHLGLERLFRIAQARQVSEADVDLAVSAATAAYYAEIERRGFDLEEGELKENEQYIVSEQCALVEAFIRSFAIRVLPDLLSRFTIIDIEREESVTYGDIVIEGRLDVVLMELETVDLYIVSFKTAASWDRRQEKANEHDNQGLSETYLLENRLHRENQLIRDLLPPGVGYWTEIQRKLPDKLAVATNKYIEYTQRFLKNEKVMGVIMIYMLKGRRYEGKTPGRWEQHCPMIRAYRKLTGTDYEYAASLWYDKPENKSGKGKLGKGWEPFTVWDCEEIGGVKGWINMLADTNNSLGEDVIGNSFKIPSPYFRNQDHINSWIRQSVAIEEDIASKLSEMEKMATYDLGYKLDIYFPQRRKGCHYPVDCEMLDICYTQEVFNDPVGSGRYMYRMPHHEREMEAHEKLYQISSKIHEVKPVVTNMVSSPAKAWDDDIVQIDTDDILINDDGVIIE